MKDYRIQLSGKTVGIAGCGGLGSNCAISLARVGLGKLIIADFDVIVEGNLNRQYFFHDQIGLKKAFALKENIQRIDEKIKVEAHDIKLSPESILELFKDCDVIVEAFDLAEMKKMIIETVLAEMPDKWIVSGIGLAGIGNSNVIKSRRIEKLIICGDETTEVSEELPPLSPRVCMVANMQANEVLEILLKK
ncbi:MAG: sulfur carrier protein ThiS adenylyltransferase ThiF [Bacteroidetes bacterium]|nr:sulfur carrier protein ThiS adenylyltransferase ThiF [Bacteroidota bacterium]